VGEDKINKVQGWCRRTPFLCIAVMVEEEYIVIIILFAYLTAKQMQLKTRFSSVAS
jgi:hypothetical protein